MVNPSQLRPSDAALAKALEILGLTTLAAACQVSYQAVQKWAKAGRVPAERCLPIQKATHEQVTCHDLRPDVFPAPEAPPARRETAAQGQTAETTDSLLTAQVA